MKSKIIIGIFIVGLLVIAGCNDGFDFGPATLKEYFSLDPLPEYQEGPPQTLVRATVGRCDKNNCTGIFVLKDPDGYSKEFDIESGQFPKYFEEVLQEGNTCNFVFDKDTIIDVGSCDKTSDEKIEKAENSYYSKISKIRVIEASGFVAPEDSYRIEKTYDFVKGGFSVNNYGASGFSNSFSVKMDYPNKNKQKIQQIIEKARLLNYQKPDCVVMDAGTNKIVVTYDNKDYEYDLISLSCYGGDERNIQTDSLNKIEQILDNIAEISAGKVVGK